MVNQIKWEIETSPGTWLDITGDVYQRDTPTIIRGRADEQAQAGPGSMTFTLENRDGKFSTRNPVSPLYGLVGRNTQVRCTMDNGTFTRFRGEFSGLPPRWDASHTDNYIQVEAFGLLRRLGRHQETVSNTLRDWVEAQPTYLMAYYPLLGESGTTYSQNLAPDKRGSFFASTGAVYAYGVDLPGAQWLGSGMELNATGDVPYMQGFIDGPAVANVALDFVFQSSALGVLDIEIWPGATPTPATHYGDRGDRWVLRLNNSADDGTLQVHFYGEDDSVMDGAVTAVIPDLQDNRLHTCRFELRTTAFPHVEWHVYIDGVEIQTSTAGFDSAINHAFAFRFHYSRFIRQTVMNMAHLAVWGDDVAGNLPLAADYHAAAMAYAGDTALDRLTRVSTDADIPITLVGTAAESMPMGPKFVDTPLDMIREVEDTDMGILVEQRDAMGLQYLARTSLYNQTAAFTLNYQAKQVSPPLEPIEDDQLTHNDVTATRREGGSDSYTIDTGRLGTADPPTGVGRYSTDFTVNPETDALLKGLAAWVANIGTLDEARWPAVTVNLNNTLIPPALRTQILNADVGDLFTITGMRAAYIYDDVSLIIVGYTEHITPFSHEITFNCMPAEPYTVGAWSTSASSGTFRWDTGGSTLNTNATATATSLSLATASGNVLWTTDSSAFPFEVAMGGERIRITNITGASSPQTATAVRSINGVVKAQTAGTDVRLWDTPRWAL